MADTKEMPVGVKILSVLEYIGAGLTWLFGLFLIVGSGLISTLIPEFAVFGTAMLIVLGILVIALGFLSFFIARGLWRGQKWARIVVIVFSCLGVLFAIIGLFGVTPGQSVVSLIINGVIGGYMWFAPEVKKAFA